MTERTDAEWRDVARSLPGFDALWADLMKWTNRGIMDESPAVRGVVADFCEQAGWLMGITCTPGRRHSARFRGTRNTIHRTGSAPRAVHALILAAEARHAADPARGWT